MQLDGRDAKRRTAFKTLTRPAERDPRGGVRAGEVGMGTRVHGHTRRVRSRACREPCSVPCWQPSIRPIAPRSNF